jgi:hypothetical protein
MPDPAPDKRTENTDEWMTISDETLRERYARVQADEADLSFEAWKARLHKGRQRWLKLIAEQPKNENSES